MRRLACALLLLPLLSVGCVSRMTVSKVSAGSEKGIRYYLPKPYLLVSPAPDGTVVVEKVFLPDPNFYYAVDTKSYAGKYKASVQLDEKGILKKVVWNTTDTESTKAALDAAANLQKARIDADVAAAKAADEKAKKAADARAAAVAAVEAARLELAQAEAALTVYEQAFGANSTEATLLAARANVEKAKMKLLAAQEALAQLDAATAQQATDTDTSALREVKSVADIPDEKWPVRAWGPVLYEIVEEHEDAPGGRKRATKVSLRAVSEQAYLPSSKKLVDAPPDVTPQATIRGSAVLRREKGNPIKFVIQVDTPIKRAIDPSTIILERGDDEIANPQKLITLNLNRNNDIFVDLEPGVKPGDYSLTFTVEVIERGDQVKKDVSVAFRVIEVKKKDGK